MSAHILQDSDFEGLRLFEPTTQIHKVVGEQIRKIMARLYTDTDINLDEFYFTVFDSKEPNAFFIEKNKTVSDPQKNIIAVSNSLINKLSCTEELAAVIAHESGHYLWDEFLGGKNTRFQERSADIHSVDLMINGGYNPRYVLEMQNKIFRTTNSDSISINVHGTAMPRMEDVRAMLTKRATEYGDFPKISHKNNDDKWVLFQNQVKLLSKTEEYHTFIEKKLYEKFGTYNHHKVNRPDLLKFLLSLGLQIKTNRARTDNMYKIFDDLNLYYDLTDSEIKSLQQLYMNYDFNGVLKYIDVFGPFKELYDYIKQFLETDDEELEGELAKKISSMHKYADNFRYLKNHTDYKITNPKVATDGTKIPPYKKLDKYDLGQYDYGRTTYSYKNIVYFNTSNYYCDKNGFVIAYGDKARKLYEHDENERRLKSDRIELKTLSDNINEKIDTYKKISDYIDDKISTKDFYKKISSDEIRSIISILDHGLHINIQNEKLLHKEIREIYKNFIKSKFYKKFYADIEPDKSLLITLKKFFNESPIKKIKKKLFALAEYAHNNNDQEYEFAILDYIKFSAKQASLNKYILEITLHYGYDWDYQLYSEIFDNKNSTIFENICKTIGFKKVPQTENELLLVLQQIQKLPRLEYESYSQKYRKVEDYIEPMTFSTVTKSKILGPKNKDISFTELRGGNRKSNIMLLFFWEYINSDYKCNPAKVARMFEHYLDKNDYIYGSKTYNDKNPRFDMICETFAKYVTSEKYQTMTLPEKIYLYEFFDVANLFSEKAGNKNMMIKIIVDEIVNAKNPESTIMYAEKILTRNPITDIDTEHKDKDIEFANEREKLLEFYSDYWAKKIGKDDKSDESLERVQSFVDFLTSKEKFDANYTYQRFSDSIKQDLANRVATKIQSQEKSTKILHNATKLILSGETAEKYNAEFIAAEEILKLLSHDTSLAIIDFLNNDLSDKSVNKVISTFAKDKYIDNSKINKQSLTILHENFWAADLPIRAYVMNRILNKYSEKSEDKLDLVLNNFMTPDSKYYTDGKLVLHSVYNNLQDYEQNLILAALIAAGKKNKNSDMSDGQAIGQGLKMFLQNKGPAFIKFGQMLSYLPSLDPDIRKELSNLRDKADIPTRADLFEMLETSLPKGVYNKISYVGKILGAGSFFVTVQIEYDGKPCVVSLMRPNAQNLTKTGIDMINNTITDMAQADKKFDVLKNIVNQARDSAMSEIDIEQDYEKYTHAKKVYKNFTINTPNATYSPDVANWIVYGAAPNKDNAYKIMEMAHGNPLTSDDISEQEKHDMAVAYTTLELGILLSGEKWDTDRHAGQQNFQEIYNHAFKEFCIGIFDTGAQMKNTPNKKEKIAFGYLLYELVNGIANGKNLNDILNDKITKLDKIGNKLHLDTLYIDGIQRGLMALSDIIQYQKEVKDENGHIIQQAKSLTKDDLQNIVMAIINSGIIDKTVVRTVKAKAVIDKLLFWRSGLIDNIRESKNTDTPISIKYKNITKIEKITKIFNKTTNEIQELINKRKKNKHLGIEKNRAIKKQN